MKFFCEFDMCGLACLSGLLLLAFPYNCGAFCEHICIYELFTWSFCPLCPDQRGGGGDLRSGGSQR